MAPALKLLTRLRRIRDAIIDRAMAAALPSCDPVTARHLAESILERGKPEGTLGLVLHFAHLPRDVQTLVIERAAQLYRPLREAAGRHKSEGPRNMLRIVREARSTRLAYLVEEQLRQGGTAMRNKAGDCLLDLARHCSRSPLDESDAAHPDAESAHFLHDAIEAAVEHYSLHQQPAVLQAMMAVSPLRLPKCAAVLSNRRHPATEKLRELLELPGHPEVRRSLLPLSALPSLSDAAVAGLGRIQHDRGLADVVCQSHLLLNAPIRVALAAVRDTTGLCPTDDELTALPRQVALNLPRWLAALPLEPVEKIDRLARLNILGDPLARLHALQQLIVLSAEPGTDADQACEVIAAWCVDPRVEIARIAFRHLARLRWRGLGRLLPRLVNSEHESIRQLARSYLAPVGFRRLWNAWPKLTYPQRLAAGRALIKIDPQFHMQLGQRLTTGSPQDRLRALSMIRDLNQGSAFEPAIRRMLQEPDSHIASAAVSALGSGEADESLQDLEAALDHQDARVRANAIEALEQRQHQIEVDRLINMSEREANRPRANAIHALHDMDASEAVSLLHRMLSDNRPNHRVSALWLIETMGIVELARHVAEMSIGENDDNVRQRAAHVIEQLLTSMGAGSASRQSEADPVLTLAEPEEATQ